MAIDEFEPTDEYLIKDVVRKRRESASAIFAALGRAESSTQKADDLAKIVSSFMTLTEACYRVEKVEREDVQRSVDDP